MIVRALSGLAHDEAENILALSLVTQRRLDDLAARKDLYRKVVEIILDEYWDLPPPCRPRV
jgi:hypothetical protein